MIFIPMVLLCAVGQDKIKQKPCDGIYGNDSHAHGVRSITCGGNAKRQCSGIELAQAIYSDNNTACRSL
jgi:hypothetical protein